MIGNNSKYRRDMYIYISIYGYLSGYSLGPLLMATTMLAHLAPLSRHAKKQ